ncbi:uncharacterized protein UTRI_10546 [Ustilago trichophora]|uniref:Effector family protein Eff1 n=1 Tax=Ustilago trichophora TaxID=86804 RepID=A0A5C3EE56_9BASI|nr:uncharacterized protein UTRI_10546 [Ustilago trichophora]
MSANIFAGIQLMPLLVLFFIERVLPTPLGGFSDWSIGQLPTGNHDHASGLYPGVSWNGGEAHLDLSDNSRPSTSWMVNPSPVVSRDAFELPHEDWFATEQPYRMHQLAGTSSGQSNRDASAQRGASQVPEPLPIQAVRQRSGGVDQHAPLTSLDQQYPFLSKQTAWQGFREASIRAQEAEPDRAFQHFASSQSRHQDPVIESNQVQLLSDHLLHGSKSHHHEPELPLGHDFSHTGMQNSRLPSAWNTFETSSMSRPDGEFLELPNGGQAHFQEAQQWLRSELDPPLVNQYKPVYGWNGDQDPRELYQLELASHEPTSWQSTSQTPVNFFLHGLATKGKNTQGTSDPASELDNLRRIMTVFDRSHKTREKWERALRSAMDLETLQFSPADATKASKDQVFIGQAHDAVEGYHPPLSSESRWTSPYERASSHFLQNLQPPLRTEKFSDIQRGRPRDRIYVYLNSGQKLDFLNDEYFLGKLQFLPIRKEILSWRELDLLYARHVQQFILPPRGRSRLPLVLVRHDGPKTGLVSYIQRLTGVSKTTHTVSLWSPILYDGSRYTIVLYGVGQLKEGDIFSIQKHLKRLSLETPHSTYHSSYNLAEIARLRI